MQVGRVEWALFLFCFNAEGLSATMHVPTAKPRLAD